MTWPRGEPFIGEIRRLERPEIPAGWVLCDGRQLEISHHPTLFALLGTRFGGDGRTTFAVPTLRGAGNVRFIIAVNRRALQPAATADAELNAPNPDAASTIGATTGAPTEAGPAAAPEAATESTPAAPTGAPAEGAETPSGGVAAAGPAMTEAEPGQQRPAAGP